MLLRLAYHAATTTVTLLRLLPMSDRDKDIEILALRHQLLVLQRQVRKPAFTDIDRFILAGLLHHLPREKLQRLLLLVRPDTIMRWTGSEGSPRPYGQLPDPLPRLPVPAPTPACVIPVREARLAAVRWWSGCRRGHRSWLPRLSWTLRTEECTVGSIAALLRIWPSA
jgi:hypothetical protein